MKDLTIFVSSCDTYSDIWESFFTCFKKFYHYQGEPIILNTESKHFSFEGLNIKTFAHFNSSEKVEWGERLLYHLKQVETEYVLFLLDDFFFRRKVDMETIQRNLTTMKNNNDIIYFSYSLVDDDANSNCEYADFLLRGQKGKYKLNAQAALWRTSDLIKLTQPSDNPWDWEDYGTRRLWYTNRKCYCVKSEGSVIDYGKVGLYWSIVRGKWVIDDVKPFFDDMNIKIDFTKRGVFTSLNDYDKSLRAVVMRLPQTIRINCINFYKRRKNNYLGKRYLKENG